MYFAFGSASFWLKFLAALLALGMHALVLAMILYAPVTHISQGQQDALDIQFVELGPALETDSGAVDDAQYEQIPEPEVLIEPPEPEFEPLIDQADIPEPDFAIQEPEPDFATQSVDEPVVPAEPPKQQEPPKPKPEPEPKPKPKPKPEPKPKPKPKPKQQPKHAPAPTPKSDKAAVAQKNSASSNAATAAPPGSEHAPDVDKPRSVGHVDYLGRPPKPVYPRLSQRRSEQGRVLVRVLISPQGTVSQAEVQSSSGFERLDKAALDAIKKARFKPYTENGIAYKAIVDIPFDFVM